jgi:hypothetical protein
MELIIDLKAQIVDDYFINHSSGRNAQLSTESVDNSVDKHFSFALKPTAFKGFS